MNDKFDNQKETLVSLSHEINLLQQQVKYHLRNEKAADLLDLDVLMNRTHTIYDMICSISIENNDDEQDFDIDPDALTALFGTSAEENEDQEEEEKTEPEETDEVTEGPNEVTEEYEETIEEIIEQETEEPTTEEEPQAEPDFQVEIETENEPEEVIEEPKEEDVPTPTEVKKDEEGDLGLFFRFEDIPLKQEEEAKDVVEEKDGKTIHIMEEVPMEEIPEKDRIDGENLIPDDPFKMPAMEDENHEPEPIHETEEDTPKEPEPIVEQPTTSLYGSFFEKDDMGFEMSTNETLGERMMGDDNSLAARYQQAPVNDLKKVIGINDKFLFVNELFGGSMEKYNKSIENLNDLKTLNGAMIYLNELKVELQWNSSNEAYKKLVSLVNKKFNA